MLLTDTREDPKRAWFQRLPLMLNGPHQTNLTNQLELKTNDLLLR